MTKKQEFSSDKSNLTFHERIEVISTDHFIIFNL
jgi:hypothetical protein